MSKNTFSGISEVLGYESKLADALVKYPELRERKDESALQEMQELRKLWGEWMSQCPHAAHLCYADITFFPEGSLTEKEALSIVIAPESNSGSGEKNGEAYKTALRKYIASGNTIAPHEVFRLGLPHAGDNFPQTSGELANFWKKNPSRIESGLLVKKLPIHVEPTEEPRNVSFSVGETTTYEDDSFLQLKEISTRPISEHFAKWCKVFRQEAEEGRLRSAAGGSPYWTIICPIGSRNTNDPSDYTLISCLFLGFDAAVGNEPDETKPPKWHESLRYIMLHLYEANATARAGRSGKRKTEGMFAHQTSVVIDSIMDGIDRLPKGIREGMGGVLMAKLYLLRETIHAYRTKSSRPDPGPFPYPPLEKENPLVVYRDIGIQLGLARCEEAPREEQEVKEMGKMARRPNFQPGQPGFEPFRRLFEEIPDVPPDVCQELRHSFFAVLILLVFKQAVYHTVRARKISGNQNARISVRVEDYEDGVLFSCEVINPPVTDHDEKFDAKDKEELRDLAERLSRLPEHPNRYLVDGPCFSEEHWKTKTCIYEKRDSGVRL